MGLGAMQAPVTVLQANTKREVGKKAQSGNIMAAKVLLRAPSLPAPACWLADSLCALQAVSDIVRTTLGPRSMLKMLLDAGGGESRLLALQQACDGAVS